MAESFSQSRLHRLIDLVQHIQSGPRFNTSQLAERYGVSRRTIFRDIGLLRECGVSITYDEGREAYSIVADAITAKIRVIDSCQLALLSAAVASSPLFTNAEVGPRLSDALQKLFACFPVRDRQQASNVANTLVTTSPVAGETNGIWSVILEAVAKTRHIRIEYATDEGVVSTKVAPYQIVVSPQGSKLVGRSSLHRETREFPLAEITRAEVIDETFETPKGTQERLRKRLHSD